MAQAIMCFNMYLLLQTDEPGASEIIKKLNNIVSATNSNQANPDIQISSDDDTFEELDLILNQKLALREGYNTENKIDWALVKQNHVLLNQLKDFKGNKGFWDKKYIPFYNWITENNYFNNFIYTLFYSSNDEDHKKIIKKESDNISEFYNAYRAKWKEIIARNEESVDGIAKNLTYYFNDSYVSAIGEVKEGEPVGNWTYYNEKGQLISKGELNNKGERIGEWTWYYPNEKIKETATYSKGKLNGTNRQWHENGKIYIESNYSLDSLDGEFKSFTNKGALYEKKYFKTGKLDGIYESYFPVGKEIIEFIVPYKNSLVEGKVLEYYSNGDIYSETNYENGQRQGVEKKYYLNKKLSSEAFYINGSYHGNYKTYHSNGNLLEEGVYVDGLLEGSVKRYFRDGALEAEFYFSNGKLNGDYKTYDYDGKPFYEYSYHKGDIVSYKFFDKKGNIVKEDKKKGGEFYYYGLSKDGNITSEGLYDVSGGKIGLWKFYSNNGIKYEQGNYENDMAEGEFTVYYQDGKKQSSSIYKNNELNGYYVDYYNNGQLKSQGYYKDNLECGEWRHYYLDGTLKEVNFYHNGKYHGNQINYDVSGKISTIDKYKYGEIVDESRYDFNENLFEVLKFESKDNNYNVIYKHFNNKIDVDIDYLNGVKHGLYERYYFSGNKRITGKYLNGFEHGEWIWYFEDGQVESKRNYVLGDLHGEIIDYYPDGQLDSKSYYEFGKSIGKWISYYENGELNTTTEYEFGENHGRKEFYSPEGILQLVRFYDHDKLIGYSYLDKDSKELPMIELKDETGIISAYFDNGNLSRQMEYKNGKLINTYKAYYYSGQIEKEITYKNGEYDGLFITYFSNGKIKERFNYIYGNRHGISEEFYDNGTLKKENNYLNDKITDSKLFDKKGMLKNTKKYFDENIYSSINH